MGYHTAKKFGPIKILQFFFLNEDFTNKPCKLDHMLKKIKILTLQDFLSYYFEAQSKDNSVTTGGGKGVVD